MSKQRPITISIWPAADGYLVVENNLVKKLTRADSTATGLYTIREKYKLLQCDDVKIEEKKAIDLPSTSPCFIHDNLSFLPAIISWFECLSIKIKSTSKKNFVYLQ